MLFVLDLFAALLSKDFDGTNVELAKLLLASDDRFVEIFKDNINRVEVEPFLLFPLLSIVDLSSFDELVLKKIISRQITCIEEGVFNGASWLFQYSDFVALLVEKYFGEFFFFYGFKCQCLHCLNLFYSVNLHSNVLY